jgi:hypothetical protein
MSAIRPVSRSSAISFFCARSISSAACRAARSACAWRGSACRSSQVGLVLREAGDEVLARHLPWRAAPGPACAARDLLRSGARPLPDRGRCRRARSAGRRPRPRPRRRRSSALAAAFALALSSAVARRRSRRAVRVDEADDQVLPGAPRRPRRGSYCFSSSSMVGELGQRVADLLEAFLDALGDADLALAGQQLDRAHLAHVHAHRVGGAAELGCRRGQRGRGFLGGVVVGGRRCPQQQLSASGAFSYTVMPMSLIMLTMSSICSGSTMSSGRWSLTSA